MAYHIIGLDRGSCAVKAVILEKSFRGYEVKGTRLVPVPQDGSTIPGEDAIQAAVSQLVDEFDPGAVGYVTAFSGRQASTWFLQMPFTDLRRIDQTLPFELENFVPFDLEDMVLDYRVTRTSGGKSRVLSSLAGKADVGAALQRLKGVKVDPRSLLLDGYALAYVPPGRETGEKALAIVDIGHCQSLVTVRLAGQPDFLRTIPLGGLRVTQALMATFGVNYRTAERMKVVLEPVEPYPDEPKPVLVEAGAELSLPIPGEEPAAVPLAGDSSEPRFFSDSEEVGLETITDAALVPETQGSAALAVAVESVPQSTEMIQQVVWEAMAPVLREIRNALMAYEGTEHREVGAVLLVGGGAMLRGVTEVLSEDLGVPVGLPSRLGPDQTELTEDVDLPRYALPFALAYLGATEGKLGEINFRIGEYAYRKNYKALRNYMLAGIAVMLLGLVVLGGMFLGKVRQLDKDAAELDSKITSAVKTAFPDLPVDPAKGLEHALAVMQEEHAKLVEHGRALGVGVTKRKSLDLLKEISAVIPGRDEAKIDVEDFSVEGDQLKLRGTADTFETVDKVQKAIQGSAMVKEVKNPDVGSKGDKKNFTLSVTLKGPDDGSGT